MRIDRRQFVLGFIASGAATTFISGCGGSKPHEAVAVTQEVSLTFSETDEFYSQFTEALRSKQNVVLQFDGEHRVGENSKMLAFLGNSSNWKELWNELQEKDTATGREELKRVFAADLLNHKALKGEPGIPSGGKLPNGEVIEPTTVILVLSILLILAATSVAHAEIARGGKYKIAIREPKTGIELYFQGEPQP